MRTITMTTEASMLVFGKSMTWTGAGITFYSIYISLILPLFDLHDCFFFTDMCRTQQRWLGPLWPQCESAVRHSSVEEWGQLVCSVEVIIAYNYVFLCESKLALKNVARLNCFRVLNTFSLYLSLISALAADVAAVAVAPVAQAAEAPVVQAAVAQAAVARAVVRCISLF